MARVPAYEIKKGDRFIYGIKTYTARADATGEFGTYIQVSETNKPDGEIYIKFGTVERISRNGEEIHEANIQL